MIPPDAPFLTPVPSRWIPHEMLHAPSLDAAESCSPIEPNYALLINPFYPKDPNASFGKHVLTPAPRDQLGGLLTPSHWRVAYGTRTCCTAVRYGRPMPQVVGITVHPTLCVARLRSWRSGTGRGPKSHPRRTARALLPRGVRAARRRPRAGRRRATLAAHYRDLETGRLQSVMSPPMKMIIATIPHRGAPSFPAPAS